MENEVFVPSTVLALRLAKVLGKTVEMLFRLRGIRDAYPVRTGLIAAMVMS